MPGGGEGGQEPRHPETRGQPCHEQTQPVAASSPAPQPVAHIQVLLGFEENAGIGARVRPRHTAKLQAGALGCCEEQQGMGRLGCLVQEQREIDPKPSWEGCGGDVALRVRTAPPPVSYRAAWVRL